VNQYAPEDVPLAVEEQTPFDEKDLASEPGVETDMGDLGIEGDAEELPEGDAEDEEGTEL